MFFLDRKVTKLETDHGEKRGFGPNKRGTFWGGGLVYRVECLFIRLQGAPT